MPDQRARSTTVPSNTAVIRLAAGTCVVVAGARNDGPLPRFCHYFLQHRGGERRERGAWVPLERSAGEREPRVVETADSARAMREAHMDVGARSQNKLAVDRGGRGHSDWEQAEDELAPVRKRPHRLLGHLSAPSMASGPLVPACRRRVCEPARKLTRARLRAAPARSRRTAEPGRQGPRTHAHERMSNTAHDHAPCDSSRSCHSCPAQIASPAATRAPAVPLCAA